MDEIHICSYSSSSPSVCAGMRASLAGASFIRPPIDFRQGEKQQKHSPSVKIVA